MEISLIVSEYPDAMRVFTLENLRNDLSSLSSKGLEPKITVCSLERID